MHEDKILPVEEMVAWEEFTGRVEILRELDSWIKNIQRRASPSTALIAPRRMGKTVLLDRLVNTVFFKPEYKVAPFYFKVKREHTTLRKFLLEYATTFFRQYLAYCVQDPFMYLNAEIKLEELLECPSEHKAVTLAKDFIKSFLNRYYDTKYDHPKYDDSRNHWDAFIRTPENLASFSGTRVAVIIDEFQDMKFYIHDVPESDLDGIMEKRRINPDMVGTNLTATYDRQSQSKKAPMLVSGSAVTLIFRTVMGGPLGGRFGFTYLKPISIPDGASLLQTLLPLYAPKRRITPEMALYASTQVTGHPYYLYCIATSVHEGEIFETKDAVDSVISYEIQQGKIYGFWQTHFEDNRKYINADNDEELGKKIIYYFTKYNNQPVDTKEIAQKLNVSKKAVDEKIEKLYLADLVFRSRAKYYTFNDICLMRYIKFVYEQDIEDVEKIDLSQQNQYNNLKGRFLELIVQVTMMKFNNEILPGSFFGKTGEIKVPLFSNVDTKYAKGYKTNLYQIDVCARHYYEYYNFWICECKYTKTKMGIKQVEKLEQAAKALKQEAEDAGRAASKIQMWLVSTGGFTQEVLDYTAQREDIYVSDYEGINGIFRKFGGNYRIPLFVNQDGQDDKG
ncbi:NTP hydrolase p-loop-containing [Desulfonema limicola]|uniref:NTP hydrolase p-loop-containing n=1 Tax=Desulfonema limicola TaxID=45656 RepID=A0A975GF74_9BACT|nr:hypothetical protein [Desulfonema limicola]QTA78884.1 NTP hydrolase p-loop-containing [Desulfonema limicola]